MEIALDAVCQAFYSLGLSMGIMLTYGVYAKKDTNMESAIKQIDFFDVLISFLAGFIIVQTVYIFLGENAISDVKGWKQLWRVVWNYLISRDKNRACQIL